MIDRFVLWLAQKNGTVAMWWIRDVKALVWAALVAIGYQLANMLLY